MKSMLKKYVRIGLVYITRKTWKILIEVALPVMITTTVATLTTKGVTSLIA